MDYLGGTGNTCGRTKQATGDGVGPKAGNKGNRTRRLGPKMSSPVAADIGRIRRSQSETDVLIDGKGQRLAKCETQKQRADSKTWADDMLE